jgi:hypothetical protein
MESQEGTNSKAHCSLTEMEKPFSKRKNTRQKKNEVLMDKINSNESRKKWMFIKPDLTAEADKREEEQTTANPHSMPPLRPLLLHTTMKNPELPSQH